MLPGGNRLYDPYDPISNYVATIGSDPEINSVGWLARTSRSLLIASFVPDSGISGPAGLPDQSPD